ncbi:MAG: HDIG domain-containing protein [Endomicrobia bacterium]|nr:HDIG domain-containing protein [Endomicrobiia bacterium]
MNLYDKARHWIRAVLLSIAKDLGAEKRHGPAIRSSNNIFSSEIKIPVAVSVVITVAAAYCMFVMGIGLSYKTMISVAIFTFAAVAFFVIHTRKKEGDILTDNDAVVLMCLLFILGILVLQISKEYLSSLIFPISAFVMMASMLLSKRIGLLYAVMLSIFAGMLDGMRFDGFLIMFCSGIFAAFESGKIVRRADFINTGIKVVAVNAAVISMFYLLHVYLAEQYYKNLWYGVLNGAFAVVMMLAFMPLFEKLFSRTTNIKLIELADFNNPLLKRLMLEAPGTYHHSLMTAAIAEQAADAIGENPLLARVCSYYHDIGKLKNPEYFIENQGASQNPHDPLTPTMSSLILASHVKDGISLAKKYNVDKNIIDAIEQHHGTTMMYFFYHKALEANKETEVETFRYPGPRPKTKTAAIVMIADSVEAACRALEEPTAVRIRETVEKVINNKFTDEQFSDCPITFKDLHLIRDSVTATLISIYHARIEYKETTSNGN